MTHSPDDRSTLAEAMQWTSRVTTISLEMVLPGLAGYWVDQQLGTEIVFLLLGAGLGFGVGMWHLIALAKAPPGGKTPPRSPSEKQGQKD